MVEVPGVDTIRGLTGRPPEVIELSYNIVKAADGIRQLWNTKFLAFLPYCFSCKEPLVWHSEDIIADVLFHCPKCGRKWIRDKDWPKPKEKNNGA